MADCVSVLAVTLVGDEKRRLGERRISAMGRFLLPSLKAEWNCVGGSGGHPSAIPLGFARGFGKTGQAFSKSARNGAPPVVFGHYEKTNPRYTSWVKWPTRQKRQVGFQNCLIHGILIVWMPRQNPPHPTTVESHPNVEKHDVRTRHPAEVLFRQSSTLGSVR
jgi:hypothetical protein